MRLCPVTVRQNCKSDYESFTKTCFSADMNRVRGHPGIEGGLLEHDHGTRPR
jgi:hypothetical protein